MGLKCDSFKRPLKHKKIEPKTLVSIEKDIECFQGYKVCKIEDIAFPFLLEKESIIIDFGHHYTGYLHIELDNGTESRIADSPTNIYFNFAEMPIEIAEEMEDTQGSLSISWLQKDFKTIPFMPYKGSLERRYSFRYLQIKRVDSVLFPIKVNAIYLDAVSAVDIEDVKWVEISDPLLKTIDDMCVKTLAECEQDVFEDGPKRDRRLWIGDLRLQALVDYETFNNIDLIKRCIYLFAERLNKEGIIAPCVFPETPPYVDQWIYLDYSLCIIPCLYDYIENTGDLELAKDLYDVALSQVEYTDALFDRKNSVIKAPFFIDHGRYDKSVAALGYFSYVLRMMIEISKIIGKPYEKLVSLLNDSDKALLCHYSEKDGLFVTESGEISWHSQTWAALSGALDKEAVKKLIEKTNEVNPKIKFSSPFMMHYYLEALYTNGMSDKGLNCIKDFWGKIADAGFDCCPECFNPDDERLSPYNHPILNSACHAWSCTPSYWIRRYHSEK